PPHLPGRLNPAGDPASSRTRCGHEGVPVCQVRQQATHPGGSVRRAVAVVRRVGGVCAGSGCFGGGGGGGGVVWVLGGGWHEGPAGGGVPAGAGGVGGG